MKKASLSMLTGMLCCMNAASVHALTITWGDNPGTAFGYSADAGKTAAFDAGIEMRAYWQGSLHPGWSSSLDAGISGPVQWEFHDVTGALISVSGAESTPGGVLYSPPDSAAPEGGPGLFKTAMAFGSPFGFLAPLTGTAAGDAYGVPTLSWIDSQNFTIHVPVMEMQWAGFASLFGMDSSTALDHGPGVDFACFLDAVPMSGSLLGNATCMAEEYLTNNEDYNWAGLTMQWQLTGTVTSAVPVPAAVWLFGSGLAVLAGIVRRCLRARL